MATFGSIALTQVGGVSLDEAGVYAATGNSDGRTHSFFIYPAEQ